MLPQQLLLGAPVGTTAGAILGAVNVVYPSDADYTLTTSGTTPQSTNKFLQVTSTPSLTATRKLIVPLFEGQDWTVQNLTTGGEAILVIGPSGTGVLVPNGSMVAVTCDGTNVLPASSSSQSSFVFQPGGTVGPNTYTTWASLYEAISAIVGAYTVVVDTTHGTATVPAGAYALGDAPTFLGLTPSTVLTFGAGASISFSSVVFQNLHVVGPAASALASNTATAWNVYFLNCFIAQTLTATTSMFAGNINVTLQSSTFNSSSTKFLDIGTATLLVTLRLLQNMVLIPNLLFNTGGAGVGTIEWDDSCSFSLPNPAGWSYQRLSTVVPTVTSPWLNVSNWYIDPANISGTASDTNDGLSAATALLTVAEMIQRYGTSSPFLTQGVTWNLLSSQTAGTDDFVFNPQSDGTGMTWIGTPQNVGGTFSPTSLTARTRGNPGNQLTFNFGTLPAGVAVGQYIKNVTRNSYAIVTSVGATSFTVSQPVHILLVDNTWTSGNTYQLFTPVGLNWINPQTSGGSLEVENVEFLDNAAVWTAAPTGDQPFFYNCQFDGLYTTLDGSKCMSIFLGASPTIYFTGIKLANCQFGDSGNQYIFLRETYMFGGSANATGLNDSSISFLDAVADGDCQLWNAIFKGSSYIGAMECDGTLLVIGGVTQMPGLNGLNFLWGGCTVNVTYGGEFSTPFYNDVTVAALQLDGVTTGYSFNDAAVGNPYTAGITITSANISTGGGAGNPGLQNPRTGSRYAST